MSSTAKEPVESLSDSKLPGNPGIEPKDQILEISKTISLSTSGVVSGEPEQQFKPGAEISDDDKLKALIAKCAKIDPSLPRHLVKKRRPRVVGEVKEFLLQFIYYPEDFYGSPKKALGRINNRIFKKTGVELEQSLIKKLLYTVRRDERLKKTEARKSAKSAEHETPVNPEKFREYNDNLFEGLCFPF
ncbi:hypothetical protein GCK72_018532 [Caenorhabditis remanei]|uniref:Uncharacterized protein n=1 Tax=Caenorhabditis remanei TaxID=31234 RepID=A0A6A5GA17_CAERE|nr:hypothetical protein GCK72_018532 [Caenorhabditis remanei]KAF1751978.1 hypothetical protein GCK72_018532 [Caenorhabditis remanei]